MKEEFTQLISENEPILLKVCNVYCREVADREDLYQDILIQLWKSFPTFGGQSKVSTWLYKIALNTAITRYRKVKRLPVKEPITEHSIILTNQDNSREENNRFLYAAIEDLNKVEKAIITLYLEEVKYQEIAEIMGISESNVGFKINRIKKKLRDKLKAMNYEY